MKNLYGCVIAGGQVIKATEGHKLQVVQVPTPKPVPELLGKGVNDRRELA